MTGRTRRLISLICRISHSVFVSNKVDLICAIATPTAQTMANATKDIPIVATAVTDYEVASWAALITSRKRLSWNQRYEPDDQQLELFEDSAADKNMGPFTVPVKSIHSRRSMF